MVVKRAEKSRHPDAKLKYSCSMREGGGEVKVDETDQRTIVGIMQQKVRRNDWDQDTTDSTAAIQCTRPQ